MSRTIDTWRAGGSGSGGGMRTGDDGSPPPPPIDLDDVDEGPMRGDLRRQIAELEVAISTFIRDNCPFEEAVASPQRGPSLLGTAELESIRDELLTIQSNLFDRVVSRDFARSMDTRMGAPAPTERRRRLRGLRARRRAARGDRDAGEA